MHLPAKIVCSLALTAILTGCSWPSMPDFSIPKMLSIYKYDIQQGNMITQDMVDQLKPGMTKSQVRFVMGTPLIADTFSQDRWDYYYSLEPAQGEEVRERVIILFENGLLVGLRGDFVPGSNKAPNSEVSDTDTPVDNVIDNTGS